MAYGSYKVIFEPNISTLSGKSRVMLNGRTNIVNNMLVSTVLFVLIQIKTQDIKRIKSINPLPRLSCIKKRVGIINILPINKGQYLWIFFMNRLYHA
jgi:hypothetical protein